MAKPTQEESKEMEIRRQIKKIWVERLGRDKNELKRIFYNDEFAWEICTNKRSVPISKGKIENLLSKSNTPEMREATILKIENDLMKLIE